MINWKNEGLIVSLIDLMIQAHDRLVQYASFLALGFKNFLLRPILPDELSYVLNVW